jgi:alanine racemase
MALQDELEEALDRYDVEEQVGGLEAALYLSEAAAARGRRARVHLNIDTGMGRSGFLPGDVTAMRRVCALPGLRVAGVMTHFPTADRGNLTGVLEQLRRFDLACAEIAEQLPPDALRHTFNSAATIRSLNGELTRHSDLVRVGAACFGVRTSREFENPAVLEPVMSVRTRVAQVRQLPAGIDIGYGSLYTTQRKSRIASLPVGFGEGYPRSLFNKGIVLVGGRRCPVVGRVSLNITTVDVTDVEGPVRWGDEAVLVGRQGEQEVTFEELAELFGSVHTELNLGAGFMNAITHV